LAESKSSLLSAKKVAIAVFAKFCNSATFSEPIVSPTGHFDSTHLSVRFCNSAVTASSRFACSVSTIASVALVSLTIISQNLNAAIVAAALAGAGFGFLPYNFNPAKIFMGDTGSTFLGFVLACISIQGVMKMYALVSFVVPVLILGLPVFDTLFAIIRRVLKGKPIMSPDRGHLHHRLLDMGFSQKQTVAILYTLTSVLCLTAVVMALKDAFRGLILILAVVVILLVSLLVMAPKDKENAETEENTNEKD